MSQRRNQRLLERFPVIKDYLAMLNQGRRTVDRAQDRIRISVKRADENLMIHRPELLDGETGFHLNPKRPYMVGTVHELISAVEDLARGMVDRPHALSR